MLTHTPRCAAKLPENLGALCLSGHTHGGQIDLPPLTRGLFRALGQPWYRGAYKVRGNHLYVSRGLGFGLGTPYPRVHSNPEVTLFRLARAEQPTTARHQAAEHHHAQRQDELRPCAQLSTYSAG